jgi:two-component system response regulator AlgR
MADPRLLIVDDEPLARARLRAQILELGLGDVVGEAANGLEALALAERQHPDVVLLDIRMPGMDGLEAARHLAALPRPPAVIFTTAYDQHALAAFESHAIDYLLKPIRTERLQSALGRARLLSAAQLRMLEGPAGTPARRSCFSAMHKGTLRIVPVEDVQYLQADRGYVTVYHRHGELLIEDSLRALEEEFGNRFVRVHRNTLVASAAVIGLEREALGITRVVLRDCAVRPVVSRRLLGEVRRRLRENG